MTEIRLHSSVDDFREVADPTYRRDPVLFTIELTVLRRGVSVADPLLLTVWNGGVPVGAAMQTPPHPLLCSGLPESAIDSVAAEVAHIRPDLVGVFGVRAIAAQFADAWQAATGRPGAVAMDERLHRLGLLRPPTGVAGTHRAATDADADLLDAWFDDFHTEALGDTPRGPRGSAPTLLWSVDGEPASLARVSPPAAGMSRIGPVFTPVDRRGHGYGSAVTAAAAQWALDAGATDVVLFTDLTNPVSNAIYQRIGFEPVADWVQIDFNLVRSRRS